MSKFDLSLFRDEIEDRLNVLPKKQVIHFAWLCSVRALPFLCINKNFDFWGDKAQIHLFSIFYVHDICMTFSNSVDAAIDATHFAYAAAHSAYAADAVIEAVYTAYAVADAVDVADVAAAYAAYAAVRAADATVRAADAARAAYSGIKIDNFIQLIQSDLKAIKANNPSQINSDVSIYGPLWKNFLDTLKANGCIYWANQYEALFNNNFITNKGEVNRRLAVPESIRKEGAAAVAKHMESLVQQGLKETKEARIILLGEKGVGKTSLARKLHNSLAFMPLMSKSTPGVDTSKLKLIPKETTHLWDFGGHVIAQAAHKCFMSAECVYILVLSGREEQQQDTDLHRKWLTTVKTYSEGKSKVFVVVNTVDNHLREMPEKKLNEEFPNLIEGFYSFNIKRDKKKLHSFKEDIRKYIEANFVRKLPAKYFDIKKELERQFRKHKKETLPESEVIKIASNLGLKESPQDALKYLNTLGVALRYDNIPGIVLNPTWISNGIYTIINYMQNKKDISIHMDDIPKVFTGKEPWRYSAAKCQRLYELMIKYELAFEMKGSRPNTLIVPSVLSNNEPTNLSGPKENEEALVRRYGFDIALADSIFPRYIQRNHEQLEQQDDKYTMWFGGMSLTKNNTYATVTKETRKIEIKVWGENKSDYLEELHNKLEALLQDHRLQWDRDEIQLPTGYVSTNVILQMRDDGTNEYAGIPIEDIMKKFNITINHNKSFINFNKGEANLGALNTKAIVDIGMNFKK
ncbi:MAG: ADP-ribosylation factor-like protein [Defluviitaleaceae bacterium]|nr:ADP-ribosylation factor-like protein [Defluviitaleaceae bacterium]